MPCLSVLEEKFTPTSRVLAEVERNINAAAEEKAEKSYAGEERSSVTEIHCVYDKKFPGKSPGNFFICLTIKVCRIFVNYWINLEETVQIYCPFFRLMVVDPLKEYILEAARGSELLNMKYIPYPSKLVAFNLCLPAGI